MHLEGEKVDSNILSEASKMLLNKNSKREQYNLPSEQKQLQNGPNFVTLRQISEKEKIDIVKLGFQLQYEEKISLKKYYEGVNEVKSLSQLRGYRVKYESIRRTKLYLKFKEECFLIRISSQSV